MKLQKLAVPAIAALLAVSGTSVFAASGSDVPGRSSQSVAGSTLRVQSIVDVAIVDGRGHIAVNAGSAAAPVMAGHATGEFGRA